MTVTPGAGGRRPATAAAPVWARAAAAAVGTVYTVLGAWAFAAPGSFYESLAAFPPENPHFLRDVGALQLGLGLAALACAIIPSGSRAVMGAIAAATALHVISHVVDIDAGGSPARDLASLGVLACLAVAAAVGMPGGHTQHVADDDP